MNPAEIVAKRREMLASLQGVKLAARERAWSLEDQKRELKNGATFRAESSALVSGHNFDLFPTPPELATRMVAEANLYSGAVILEPSAGTGRILDAIKAEGYTARAIDLSYSCVEFLRKRGYAVECTNFMDYTASCDRIIMNPPFSNSQDIDHVLHAFDLLNNGGRIVAIMSEGTFYRNDKKATAFREFLDIHGICEQLKTDTFKASGTRVNTRLVIIDK